MERQASQASYLSTTSDMAYSLSACVALSCFIPQPPVPCPQAPSADSPPDPATPPDPTTSPFQHTLHALASPPFPLYPTPESLAPHLSLPPDDLVPLLRHAVLFATRHADLVLLKWLFALEEPTVRFPSTFCGNALCKRGRFADRGGRNWVAWALQRRLVPLDATDDEGCNILTSAILGSSGKEDKEECARLIARSIGVEATDNCTSCFPFIGRLLRCDHREITRESIGLTSVWCLGYSSKWAGHHSIMLHSSPRQLWSRTFLRRGQTRTR